MPGCITAGGHTSKVLVKGVAKPSENKEIDWAKAQGPQRLIRGATILTAAGAVYAPGYLWIQGSKIREVGVGDGPEIPGSMIVERNGQFITPGIIDTHSHMGVYASPSVRAHSDGNESTGPITAEVSAEHGIWPLDPNMPRAVAGGVTTVQILPGSANLIGGRSAVIKLRPANSARAMLFSGAPSGLKIACGENPKGVYGTRGGPRTRMGNIAGFREAFQNAAEYKQRWDKHLKELGVWKEKKGKEDDKPDPPSRDFGMETLMGVLNGEILVHNHCYRADEMNIMLDLAKEYGFKIRSFHHALEAYKLADRLAKEGVSVSTWADWWGFKMEAYDGIRHNVAIVHKAGARAIIHSDSETDIRHLNHEAVKARVAGAELGLTFTDDDVLKWFTLNPAWALGIDHRVGSLEAGKDADFVIWDGHPLTSYAKASEVFIDGHRTYSQEVGLAISDFELGQR